MHIIIHICIYIYKYVYIYIYIYIYVCVCVCVCVCVNTVPANALIGVVDSLGHQQIQHPPHHSLVWVEQSMLLYSDVCGL